MYTHTYLFICQSILSWNLIYQQVYLLVGEELTDLWLEAVGTGDMWHSNK